MVDDPTIGEIATRLDRTPSQVTLRWHLQRGDIVFPKTLSTDRMRENFALFDFELGDADVAALSALDEGEPGRTGPNPNTDGLDPALTVTVARRAPSTDPGRDQPMVTETSLETASESVSMTRKRLGPLRPVCTYVEN